MADGGAPGRWPIAAAALLLALATVAGAMGAHVLAAQWAPARMHVYDIAVRYQFYQALGLFGMGLWLSRSKPDDLAPPKRRALRWCAAVAWALLAAIVLFCGGLYALCFGAPAWVGMVTPAGGTLFIVAWVGFALGVWRS